MKNVENLKKPSHNFLSHLNNVKFFSFYYINKIKNIKILRYIMSILKKEYFIITNR